MLLIYVLLTLLAAAILAFWAGRLPLTLRPWLLPLPAAGAFGLLAVAGSTFLGGEAVAVSLPWVPLLELDFALQLHGFGLLMALLIVGIGTLIITYATGYMGGHPQAPRLYAYLYAFMLAMTGVVLSDHLLLLFIFWELTSITSYLLIGFNHADETSRKKALQALIVTGLGGMALLAGFILLRVVSGTWLLSELVAHHDQITGHALYPAILTLVLLGALTKSAQFPFHFWLPNAMAAPTPVSAYLHSATMVKAGVFLLAVLLPVIGGTEAWTLVVSTAGGITLLLGGWFGLQQHDLKKILAATTLAVLGLLTLLLGIGTEKAVLAAVLFLLGHALYKATLFMVAGAVDHEAGTRDTQILGGLGRLMPWTAGAAALAAVSKMGLPPLFGFIGKEYVYKASLCGPMLWLVTGVLILGNALLFALAFKVAFLPFWRKAPREPLPKHAHEAPWPMRLGPVLLATLGLGLGVMPGLTEPLVAAAKSTSLGYPASAEVKLWAGINLPLLLSIATVTLGAVFSWQHNLLGRLTRGFKLPTMEQAYEGILDGTLKAAAWQTRLLQSGYLHNYLITILVTTLALVLSKLWRYGGIELPTLTTAASPQVWVIAVLMLAAMGFAIGTTSRLTALISLGVVGFGVAFLFAYFSAPDLAITQILVETLTVALFAWVVYQLPGFKVYSARGTRGLDALVAGVTGVLVTILVLKSKALDIAPSISATLAEWSLTKAYGANVVNVILVDFRALDTWGEITVLAIAALGVWALLSQRPRPTDKEAA